MTLKRKMKLLGSDHANHGWLQVELFLQNHEKPALRRLGSPNSAFVHSASSFAFDAKSFPCPEFLARSPWQSQPVKLEEPHQLRKPNLPPGSVTGCATCIAKDTQQVTIRTNFMSLTDLSFSQQIELCTSPTPIISTWTASSQSCSGP